MSECTVDCGYGNSLFLYLLCVAVLFQQINTVWVDCEGENPADAENIGPIKYYPHRGFPAYYFPFKNLEGYLSPLVAVNFEEPKRKSMKNRFNLSVKMLNLTLIQLLLMNIKFVHAAD